MRLSERLENICDSSKESRALIVELFFTIFAQTNDTRKAFQETEDALAKEIGIQQKVDRLRELENQRIVEFLSNAKKTIAVCFSSFAHDEKF